MKQVKINRNLKTEADKMKDGPLVDYLEMIIDEEWDQREKLNTTINYPLEARPNIIPNRISVLLPDGAYEKAKEMAQQDLRSISSFLNWLIATNMNQKRQTL